jgi:hypothetical protein
VPVRVDSYHGVVLETSFQEGIRREALRSLAQLVNSSEVALQVCSGWKQAHRKTCCGLHQAQVQHISELQV